MIYSNELQIQLNVILLIAAALFSQVAIKLYPKNYDIERKIIFLLKKIPIRSKLECLLDYAEKACQDQTH